jgi:hypothetical protein
LRRHGLAGALIYRNSITHYYYLSRINCKSFVWCELRRCELRVIGRPMKGQKSYARDLRKQHFGMVPGPTGPKQKAPHVKPTCGPPVRRLIKPS